LPKEAALEKTILEAQDIKSLMIMPVYRNQKVVGFIGLDSVKKKRHWTVLEIENLKIHADIISIAVEHERTRFIVDNSSEMLLKSEAKFRLIFEKLSSGLELYNEQGELLDLNDADKKIFGMESDHQGKIDLFKNPHLPPIYAALLKKGKSININVDYDFGIINDKHYYKTTIEDGIKHLNVQVLPIKDAKDKIFGYIGMISDETDNYHKREELEFNLTKLKAAVSTGNSFIWEYDISTDRFSIDQRLSNNETDSPNIRFIKENAFVDLKDCLNRIHSDDMNGVYDKVTRLISGEIDNYVATYRITIQEKTFWLTSDVRAYSFNSDGTPNKIISYTTDVTEYRENENELVRVKEADKLKSAFLASMSHEIRTPLNAIVGFVDIVSETTDASEKEEYLSIIHKNTDLLLHLIDDILDFSKIEAGTFNYRNSKTDIKEICGELYTINCTKMQPGIKLLYDQDSPSIIIETDASRISQVISNFINNAIKFTTKGSITIEYEKRDENLWVAVKDTGIGIDEKDREKIFERFVKLNDFKQGTGLGLAISKTIIEDLGGQIGVDSKLGEGSTFWFTLPLNKNKK
jgi:signal transduction histidine kinase/PAS domain-containing protein